MVDYYIFQIGDTFKFIGKIEDMAKVNELALTSFPCAIIPGQGLVIMREVNRS